MAFGYSPLLESVLSLHVLAEPKHHALQHAWVRAMRNLPSSLRREIARCRSSTAGRSRTPSFRPPTSGYDDFGVELARLRRLRTDVVAFELPAPDLRPRRRRAACEAAHPFVAGRSRECAEVGGGSRPRVTTRRCAALRRPARLVERFASLLDGVLGAGVRSRVGADRAAARRQRRARRPADRGRRHGRRSSSRSRRSSASTRADAASGSTSRTTTASAISRAEPAAARAERLRLAARARQLRRRRGRSRSSTARRTSSTGLRRSTPPQLVAAAEGARRPDAPADPRAPREAAAEHAGARAARRPHRRRRVEAAAPARVGRPPDDEARGLLRRLLARAGEARDAVGRARPPRRRLGTCAPLRVPRSTTTCVIGTANRSRAFSTTPRSSQCDRPSGCVEMITSSGPNVRSASSIACNGSASPTWPRAEMPGLAELRQARVEALAGRRARGVVVGGEVLERRRLRGRDDEHVRR